MELIAMSLATDLTRRSGRRLRRFHHSIDSQNKYSKLQKHRFHTCCGAQVWCVGQARSR